MFLRRRRQYSLNNTTLFTFTDTLNDINNLETFTRTINNQIYYFVEGKLIVKSKGHRLPKIRKLDQATFSPESNEFLTMDFSGETRTINNVIIPSPECVCISPEDGRESFSFYLSDSPPVGEKTVMKCYLPQLNV